MNNLSSLIKNGKVSIIDTRPFEEYLKGHIPDSVLAPYTSEQWFYELSDFIKHSQKKIIIVTGKLHDLPVFKEKLSGIRPDSEVVEYSELIKLEGIFETSLEEIDVDTLISEQDKWNIIDVREPFEWTTGVIPEALMISMNDIPNNLSSLDKTKKYAVVCEHGNRSLYAAIYLADRGLKVASVKDGMVSYRMKKMPMD
ncbi:MAG: rhodanese-like domain-containing protein [Thermoplasmataceae archaeon]